jgi:hypothetical protein
LAEDGGKTEDRSPGLYTLAMVNTAIWAISIVGLVLVIQRAPSAKGLFVILASGMGMSLSLLSRLRKGR